MVLQKLLVIEAVGSTRDHAYLHNFY